MLCGLCWFMLRGQEQYQWRGSFDLNFDHHKSVRSLRQAANARCRICMALRDQFPHHLSERWYHDDKPLSITAGLCRQPLRTHDSLEDAVYRLDFRLACDSFRSRRTFILKDTKSLDLRYHTDMSDNTSSDEVLHLACQWMNTCKCVDSAPPGFYPRRLLTWLDPKGEDMDKPKLPTEPGEVSGQQEHGCGRPPLPTRVRLVETKEWENNKPPGQRVQYVTLSHCWGAKTPKQRAEMLSRHRIRALRNGIEASDMEATFRDAIRFARRLDPVGYIWIDCFCILQGGKDEVYDWLSQSGEMDRVYGSSFLNLSATSVTNDSAGLFVNREHRLLWEDDINLDTADIPKSVSVVGDTPPGQLLALGENSDIPELSRCVLLDASFWDSLIEEAPVNSRGWVLQERIMARRVLHFCRSQIAWECCEFETAEAYPTGLPMYRLRSDEIVDRSRLRKLNVTEGRALRLARLRYGVDPDGHLGSRLYIYELWKNIVEVYSRTALTNPGDKLVALSGLARRIASRFEDSGCPSVYHAGLWSPIGEDGHQILASQLLWRVEPKVENDETDVAVVSHLATRPKEYRAPSFSWASLDTDKGKGIVCAELTNRNILIKIVHIDVAPRSRNHVFGMVENDGSIIIRGMLRQVKLYDLDKGTPRAHTCTKRGPHQNGCTMRVGWTLLGRSKELQEDKHANTYPDCLAMDEPDIIESERTYCLPVGKGDRIYGEDHIIALLLVEAHGQDPGTFRRIGLTKISSWSDEKTHKAILEVDHAVDKHLPCLRYLEKNGLHEICIV